MSRQFPTNVRTIYDIFCPVPFLPSPFGFRRLKSAHIKAHGRVQEDVHGNAHESCCFLCQSVALLGAHKDSHESAHDKFDSAHENVHKVWMVVFHMFYLHLRFVNALPSQTEIYPVQNWSMEMPWAPFSRPKPQYWD